MIIIDGTEWSGKGMIILAKNLIIRSSSAEFLIFERQKGEKGIEVRFEAGDLWLTQKAIADLFNTSKQGVRYHLKTYLIHWNQMKIQV